MSNTTRIPWRPTLRFSFGFILVVLTLATAGAITANSYYTTRSTLLEFSEDLIGKNADLVRTQVLGYLEPARLGVEMSLKLARAGMVDVDRVDQVERYCYDFLVVHPSISVLNWGDERGNFVMVKRLGNGALSTKIVRAINDSTRDIYWKHRDPGVGVDQVRERSPDKLDYDCRTRPWYKGARETGTIFWTDVYVFFSDQLPGVTVSAPLYEDDGTTLKGVVSLDIGLVDLSHFLRDSVRVGRTGQAVIIDAQNRIVAMPQVDKLTRVPDDGGLFELRPLSASPSPEIGALAPLAEAEIFARSQRTYRYSIGGCEYLVAPVPIDIGNRRWTALAVAPEADFLEEAQKANLRNAITAGLMAAVSVLLAFLVARMIARPLDMLATESDRLRELHFEDSRSPSAQFDEVLRALFAFKDMKTGLRAFQKYVPTTLVRSLLTEGVDPALGGENRELTMLFSDIRGFTGMSEKMEPEMLSQVLCEYLSAVTDLIHESNGTVDKYVGDAVVAFWNAPQRVDDHAVRACRTALAAQKRISEVEQKYGGKHNLYTRIGINTASVIVGNFGSTDRMSYTAMGDGMNLASRLEGVNKHFGTRILISESTRSQIGDAFVSRLIGNVAVKGRKGGVSVYELVGEAGSVDSRVMKWIEAYQTGVSLFMERKWTPAIEAFEDAHERRKSDQACEVMLEECRKYKRSAPDDSWDGTLVMTEK